jgi:chemotaxis protein CheD
LIILGSQNGNIKTITSNHLSHKIKGFKTYTIIGGEFAITLNNSNIAFKTLLGSCVSIMFYDKIKKIKGMNHFLLPHTQNLKNDMRYGLYSVKLMLNEMYKIGANKSNLEAKIAGGADIMNFGQNLNNIGTRNIEFAKEFCESENIKIVSEHIGGTHNRVVLLIDNFETYIRIDDTKKAEIVDSLETQKGKAENHQQGHPQEISVRHGVDRTGDQGADRNQGAAGDDQCPVAGALSCPATQLGAVRCFPEDREPRGACTTEENCARTRHPRRHGGHYPDSGAGAAKGVFHPGSRHLVGDLERNHRSG